MVLFHLTLQLASITSYHHGYCTIILASVPVNL